jgi:uncharacterized RDD family membrane protein YckC
VSAELPPPGEPSWRQPGDGSAGGWLPPAPAPPPAVAALAAPVLELATFWARVGAAAIDFLVRLAIIAVPAAIGAVLFLFSADAGIVGVLASGGFGALIASLVYAPLMMARTNGQTVGHRAVGTRIVKVDGTRMTGGRAFVREVLVKNLLMEGIGSFTLYALTLVNYLFPLWDEGNEALHDKICKTRVVVA